MAFSNTVLTPPTVPRAAFLKEESVDSFKGCTTILEVGITLKSSLKQHRYAGVLDSQTGLDVGEVSRRRSVQWIDKLGKELADLREFEPSDMGDEELDPLQACACAIQ
eukprot:c15464_g1_i1 orf=1347-1670(+)